MPRNQKDFTYDRDTLLKVAGLVAATTAHPLILDLGPARMDGRLIVDISAVEVASGDEKFEIEVQVSNSPTFASGIFLAGTLKFGAAAGSGETVATVAPRRAELGVTNERNGTTYRYLRLNTRVGGTIATGINYTAFLVLAG